MSRYIETDRLIAFIKEHGKKDTEIAQAVSVSAPEEPKSSRKPCGWCDGKSVYFIVDDDFAQPVHTDLISYCFFCGRRLR